jgi:hypothetical protein
MIKSSLAVPLAEAILSTNLLSLRVGGANGDRDNAGQNSLKATVKRRTVEALDWWIKGFQMIRKLDRLILKPISLAPEEDSSRSRPSCLLPTLPREPADCKACET